MAGGAVLQSEAKIDKPLGEGLVDRVLALLGQAHARLDSGRREGIGGAPWEGVQPACRRTACRSSARRAHPRLFVNAAHGPAGWGLACGSAKVVADLVSGLTPDVPADTLAALRIDRF